MREVESPLEVRRHEKPDAVAVHVFLIYRLYHRHLTVLPSTWCVLAVGFAGAATISFVVSTVAVLQDAARIMNIEGSKGQNAFNENNHAEVRIPGIW